jgi:uncharacterized membrane protein
MGDENSESEVNSLADLVPKVARRIETSRESVREACKKIAELYQYNHNSLRRKYQRSLENYSVLGGYKNLWVIEFKDK